MSEIVEFHRTPDHGGPIETPTFRKISRAVHDCHTHGRLAVIRGGFGIGKTFVLRRYTEAHPCDVAMATLGPTTRSLTGGLSAACVQVARAWEWYFGEAPRGTSYQSYGLAISRSIQRMCREIIDQGGRLLLIIDEAQHARPDLLDEFRGLYDEGLFGLAISGNQALFDPRRGRMETADFGALLSRADHVLDIPAAPAADIDAVLDAHRIAAKESRALLERCAAAGGLREMIHVIDKAQEISGAPLVGLKHLKAAAASTGLSGIGWHRRR